MRKKYLILACIFILSTASAFYFEEYYRTLVRYLFRKCTNDSIYFIGKNFHLFASFSFVFSFGFFCSILYTSGVKQSPKQIAKQFAITILLFVLTTVIISYFNSHFKIIECTACNDGRRGVGYNGINYDLIFIASLTVAIIPSIIWIIKRKRSTQ